MPAPGGSSINTSFYVSRGYLLFVPDIPYRIGYPGESALDAVVPGVLSIADKGFVDRDKIGVQVCQRPALLARLRCLRLQPGCKLVGERIELARPFRHRELRLDRAGLQILLDGVAGEPGPPGDLPDRQLLSQSQAADDVQKSHVDHSIAPFALARGKGSHGSNLSGNQAASRVSSGWKSTT